MVAERVSAFLEGREKGWLSWEAIRGSIFLAILALVGMVLMGFAAGFVLLGAVIAVSVHLLGIADVPGLVRGKVMPE